MNSREALASVLAVRSRPGESALREKSFRLEIFVVSLAAILLEIAFTRIFSFKLYYYFTYLILGIALLGLGSGGVLVALSERLRRLAPEGLIAACCLLGGMVVPLSYLAVARLQINTLDLFEGPGELLALGFICLMLFAPFLAVGVVLATMFGARPGDVSRLYFSDLMGAGLGCALCVPLFATVTPPGTVLLAGALLALAGLRLSLNRSRSGVVVGIITAALLLPFVAFPKWIPDAIPDRIKVMSPQQHGDEPVLFSRWSSLFRIDVIKGMTPEKNYLIAHDGMQGSIVHAFNGDWSSLREFDGGLRSLPFTVLAPGPEVMIIGSAGGHEILASLYFGAKQVTGVEINPVTVSLLQEHFLDYSGRIAENPRVRLVNAEARSFISRDEGRYDLIWFVAPDSYAAMNAASSGAFVLSESYLYTAEMVEEAITHLAEGGILCVQFGEINFDQKPNRSTRFLVTAREALRRLGIEDFGKHVLLSTAPGIFTAATTLLKREPFTAEEVKRFTEASLAIENGRMFHPRVSGDQRRLHPTNLAISLPPNKLAAWQLQYPYDISVVTDDSPFFWHFVRFRDALLQPWGESNEYIWDPEDATGERMLLTLLIVATLGASVFLVLPLLWLRDTWSRVPYKANAFVYFAALGLGFMFFEVALIQKLTLFLGYPTYSLTVTLFSLLVFSGCGSLLSSRYSAHRNQALWRLLGAVLVLMLVYQFGVGLLVEFFVGAPLFTRVLLTVLLLAPLGLCLGAFMPIGLATLASLTEEHQREYIAWGWAVNGFFSVVSSVLATMLSMSYGFRVVLLLGAIVYAIGVVSMTQVPEEKPRAG